MNHDTALQKLVSDPAIESFRRLCREDNPNTTQRDAYRDLVVKIAQGHRLPSLAVQAGNAITAAGRIVKAIATGQAVMASPEVKADRLAICLACEFYDRQYQRCQKCGCGVFKLELATERCPIGKWEAGPP